MIPSRVRFTDTDTKGNLSDKTIVTRTLTAPEELGQAWSA